MSFLINTILKLYIRLKLKLFFRKWQVEGIKNIPVDKPVIFAANHQNAFLDALMITCSSSRLPYYLARAEVFKNKWAAKALTFIRIMPIYRFRDGLQNVKKNDAIIEACNHILSKNHCLVIFPEGNHAQDWNLRPLQRGLSRIAFKTMDMANWNLDLVVIPVGIQYEGPQSFQSRVMVQFGAPIAVKNYKNDWENNQREAFDVLKKDLWNAMRPLLLHINPKKYESIESGLFEKRPFKRDMVEQLQVDQEIANLLDEDKAVPNYTSDKQFINPLSWLLALPAWIINILPYLFTQWFIKKFVTDPVFTSSIKLAAGVVVAPLFYLFIATVSGIISQSLWVAALTWVIAAGTSTLGIMGLRSFYSRLRKPKATIEESDVK